MSVLDKAIKNDLFLKEEYNKVRQGVCGGKGGAGQVLLATPFR
jgi:hypothetical protein